MIDVLRALKGAVSSVGQRVGPASPLVTSRLPNGVRLDGRLCYRLRQRRTSDLLRVEAAAVVRRLRRHAGALEATALDDAVEAIREQREQIRQDLEAAGVDVAGWTTSPETDAESEADRDAADTD